MAKIEMDTTEYEAPKTKTVYVPHCSCKSSRDETNWNRFIS